MTSLTEFGRFFTRPWGYLKRHLFYASLTWLVHLGVYFLVARGLLSIAQSWFVDRVLVQFGGLLGTGFKLLPRSLFDFGYEKLEPVLIPLILYLAWMIAANISSIITGLFNTRLSVEVEKEARELEPRPGKTKTFEILEDLALLALNISLSLGLVYLFMLSGTPKAVSKFIFWGSSCLLMGLYNLSYPLLSRGYSYAQILGLAASARTRLSRLIGFSLASGLIPITLAYLAVSLTWSHLTFALLLGVFSLFRPIGIVSGTVVGNEFLAGSRLKPVRRGFGYFLRKFTLIGLGLALSLGMVDLGLKIESKLDLFSCEFRVSRIESNFDFSKGLDLNQITRFFLRDSSLEGRLEITNPGANHITLEEVRITARFGDKEFASTRLSGIDLAPQTSQALPFEIKFRPIQLGKNLFSGGAKEFLVEAEIKFKTLWGHLPWKIRLINS